MAGTDLRNDDRQRDALEVWFVLEQTLGHVTHSDNLRRLTPSIAGVTASFLPVEFDPGPRRIPVWSNWTIRAGLRGAAAISRRGWSRGLPAADAMFVHTQVPAVLLGPWMRRTPTVVSLDATPLQYDALGEFYAHERGPELIERMKHGLHRRCFERAAHLVTWSAWAKQGLIDDYGIDADRITVIAPGVDVDRWRRDPHAEWLPGPVRILFVGGDLHRKGGDLLIEAVRELRSDSTLPEVELHLVTPAAVDDEPGVIVHSGLRPNSPELISRYHEADVFCLPTLGDCLPMVLAEAAAASLPLIATDVGAIAEIVRPGETGELVTRGDVGALTETLGRLVADADLRRRYGHAARRLAEAEHDARANVRSVLTVVRECAARR